MAQCAVGVKSEQVPFVFFFRHVLIFFSGGKNREKALSEGVRSVSDVATGLWREWRKGQDNWNYRAIAMRLPKRVHANRSSPIVTRRNGGAHHSAFRSAESLANVNRLFSQQCVFGGSVPARCANCLSASLLFYISDSRRWDCQDSSSQGLPSPQGE